MTTTQELLADRTEIQRSLDTGVQMARDFLSTYPKQPFLFVAGQDSIRAINPPAEALSTFLRRVNPATHDTVLNNLFTSSAIGCRQTNITPAHVTGDRIIMLEAKPGLIR